MKNNYLRCLSILTANSKQQTADLAGLAKKDCHFQKYNFTKMIAVMFVGFLILLNATKLRAQCTLTGSWTMSPTSCPETGAGSLSCSGLLNGTPPYECSISPNAGVYIPNSTTGGTFLFLPANTYTITTTDANGNCGISVEVVTSTIPLMQETFVVTPATCGQANGASCVTITNGSGNYSYEWTPQLDPFTILSTTTCLTGVTPAIYRLKVTDTITGCIRIFQTTITDLPISLFLETTNSNCVEPNCDGTATLTLTGTAPYNITWTSGGLSNATYNTSPISLTGLCPGTYTGAVIDANGCSANINFTVNLEGADVVCNGNCSSTTNTDFHQITSNTLWNPAFFGGQTTIVVNTNVIVKPGVTLTIEDLTVLVVRSKSIRAEMASNIIAENSTFDAICGTTWRGFEIQGQGIGSTLAQRSVLEMTDCVVRHAECAIRNHNVGPVYNYTSNNPANTGGKIVCENSLFEENVSDVFISTFVPTSAGSSNASAIFTNCDFEINNIPSGNETNTSLLNLTGLGRIRMVNTSDVRFHNCNLVNFNPTYESPNRIIGLTTAAANFEWTGNDVGNNWTPANYQSSIIGFRRGMDIRLSGLLGEGIMLTATINNTHLRCHQGISMLNRITGRIENNLFENYIASGFTHSDAISDNNFNGLYSIRSNYQWNTALVAQPLYIAHNSIIDAQNTINSWGIILDGLGDMTNYVVENRFETLRRGLVVVNCNRTPPAGTNNEGEGLRYECNRFVNNDEDILYTLNNPNVTTQPLNHRGVASPQTNTFELEPDESAGNNFFFSFSSTSNNDDIFFNATNSASGLLPHYYQYHANDISNSDLEMTTAWHDPDQVLPFNDCDYDWRSGPLSELMQEQEEGQTRLEELKGILANLVDGGNTAALKQQIIEADFNQAWDLYQQLLYNSPALSEEAMLEAIKKEVDLPKEFLTDILRNNPHSAKSLDLTKALEERYDLLDEYQMSQVMEGKNWFSAVERLQQEIDMERANITRLKQDISFRLQNQPGSLEAMVNLWNENSTLNELKQKAEIMIRSGQIESGFSLLHNMYRDYPNTLQNESILLTHLLLKSIEIDVLGTGRNSLNGEEFETVNNIFQNDEDGQGFYAGVLLNVFAGMNLDESINFTFDTPEKRSQKFENISNTGNNQGITAFPNPFKDIITIQFSKAGLIPPQVKVFNHLGTLVHSEFIEPKQSEKTLHLDALPAGIYFVQVCDANQMIVAQISILKN